MYHTHIQCQYHVNHARPWESMENKNGKQKGPWN